MTKQRINWDQVKAKLRAGEIALQSALSENPARIQAAYRKRALHLAKSSLQPTSQTPPVAALIFTLKLERYALRLHELAEVLPFKGCTPVPGSGREFLGVIARHGELRPVIDLGRVMLPEVTLPDVTLPDVTLPDSEGTTAGFILMLRKPGRQIGLRVDHVEGLRELDAAGFDPAWNGNCTTRISGETLLLIDSERLLASYL